MRTIVRIVPVLLALALLGCPGEARFRIAFDGSSQLQEDIKYKFLNKRAQVIFGANCYGGMVTLHVKVKNSTDDILVYDWTDALIFVEEANALHLDTTNITLYDKSEWQTGSIRRSIPPDAEWTYDIRFPYMDYLSDTVRSMVHIKPGRILNRVGEEICQLPKIYGDPSDGFYTPFKR